MLADIDGPGTIRHIWMTIPPAPPEVMRSLFIEVFYDGLDEPSVSVPFVDFFGLPHGRPVEYHSALHAVQEGRGFNSYVPMPFGEHVRIVATNGGERSIILYYQVDYTLGPLDEGAGYLHVGFRRQNPTVQKRDFVIVDGLEGPGRFLGCAIGVRVIDAGDWYGEGEVKVFRDGDDELPTICGTGLEDYVGSAWGMGAHAAPYGGAPLNIGPRRSRPARVRQLLPMARARPDHVHVRPEGHDPADRREVLPARRRGHARGVRGDASGRGRGLAVRREGSVPRVGHRRARRRLLRGVVRVLHAPASSASARARRRARRHRTPPLGDRPPHRRRSPRSSAPPSRWFSWRKVV